MASAKVFLVYIPVKILGYMLGTESGDHYLSSGDGLLSCFI